MTNTTERVETTKIIHNQTLIEVNKKLLARQNVLLLGKQIVSEVEWMTASDRAARIAEITQCIAIVAQMVKE